MKESHESSTFHTRVLPPECQCLGLNLRLLAPPARQTDIHLQMTERPSVGEGALLKVLIKYLSPSRPVMAGRPPDWHWNSH